MKVIARADAAVFHTVSDLIRWLLSLPTDSRVRCLSGTDAIHTNGKEDLGSLVVFQQKEIAAEPDSPEPWTDKMRALVTERIKAAKLPSPSVKSAPEAPHQNSHPHSTNPTMDFEQLASIHFMSALIPRFNGQTFNEVTALSILAAKTLAKYWRVEAEVGAEAEDTTERVPPASGGDR